MSGNHISTPRELLELLAPEKPMNNDEMGGCIWCGKSPPGDPYGYAEADPSHHEANCPWIRVRALLAASQQSALEQKGGAV